MRALVTGSAGFIGRHFARHLCAEGWEVLGLDVRGNQVGGHFSGSAIGPWPETINPEAATDCRWFFEHDPTDPSDFDLVVHAAAHVGGRAEIDGAPLAVAANLAIDSDLFQWAARVKPGRVLYFSSSAAYPVRAQGMGGLPLEEDLIRLSEDDACPLPWVPDASYGWAKLTGEMLAGLARAEGVNVTVVRPFSGYGSDQSGDYPFGAFIDRARAGGPFTVWGDGRQVRDFVHVDDIVAACMAIIDSETVEPVNIGTGRPTSFDELADLILDVAGAPRGPDRIEIVHDLSKPSGVRYRVADVTRLHGFYRPRITIEEGIARALKERA